LGKLTACIPPIVFNLFMLAKVIWTLARIKIMARTVDFGFC
jgi:hypothetical protein